MLSLRRTIPSRRSRPRPRPRIRAAAAATALVGALLSAVVSAGAAQAAAMTTLYASPSGTGTACSSTQPCSITQAKTSVRAINAGMTGDIVVQLADGTYRLSAPLSFTAADSGNNGHTVVWKAAPGANPIISGAQKVTGWSQFDASKDIWRANVGTGFDTRQLYVDGLLATRARTQVTRSDLTFNPTGFTFTNSALSYLNTLANQSRVELETLNSWTDRYMPVQSISNNTFTMQQPAWDNNTWGWDTVQSPFRKGPAYLENAYEFLDAAGEWYLNTATGYLYYKPLAGQDLSTADVELPRLESLISVGGTYSAPAHDLSFVGVQFSHTSWLHPSTNEGWADQQTGGYIQGNWNRPSDAFTSCKAGCSLFEATRPNQLQMPAAVQVSAANHVTFSADKFIGLGQEGLGIGEDANANTSGVGLGAGDITVIGSLFNQIAAGGVIVGGYQADAHHPSDVRMTNKNITIKDNLIHDVALDYRDNDAILATYTTNAVISYNEVYNLPYTGISIGEGWGVNDPGGSQDYVNRGLYNYQPIYNTPTTATGNSVTANYVHDFLQSMNDGGCFYTLSANPSSVFDQNYCTNGPNFNGMYFDEGSRYISATNNVFNVGPYAHQNATSTNNTGNFTLTNNWATKDGDVTDGNRGSVVSGTVIVTGGAWPSGAQTVMNAAGLEPAYQYLKYPVTAPYSSFAVNSPATFSQANGQFAITEAGTDVWGAGGQHDDQYGAIYQNRAFTNGTTVTTKVSQLDNTNAWAKAGIMVRNNMTAVGSSAGYAVMAVTPGNGVVLGYDSNGDGYLDTNVRTAGITAPVWLRLTRTGNQVSGYYSTNGTTFTQVGSAVNLSGANAIEDAGVFHSSHDVNVPGTATFGSLSITTSPLAGYANIPALLDQHQSQLSITGAGADVWGVAPQHDDQYGAVYQSQAFSSGTTVTVKVDQMDDANAWAKAGIMVRNNMTAAGSSAGYAVMAVTPGNGVVLAYDSNGDGYLDTNVRTAGITAPVWLRLTRTGNQVSGYYSTNGTTFTQVGSAVNLSGANATEDAGVFHTSHDNKISGTANFSGLSITTSP
ncbi:right-handed parallel beta-helix repeat-containing protein [Streptomyces sp. NPDC050121]|uniref:right-handed parallel beta-helix repeat-containing protein n=1 Tax=Streptomyces sp. NPDC050121 TaxID=3365601 RepID=UPI0037B930A0